MNVSLLINRWRNYYAQPAKSAEASGSSRWSEYNRLIRLEQSASTSELLILDELGEASGTDFVGNKLYTLIEERVSHLRPIICTSNLSWEDLGRKYGDDGARVVGRLQEQSTQYTLML